jgi:predicted RNA-binding Zn-ribbon protein involved in translation (DUF1610 family)
MRTSQSQIEVYKCPKCGEMAEISTVAYLPKGGRLVKAVHQNKEVPEHRWVGYSDLNQFGKQPKKKRNPIRMHCPKCGKIGTVNEHYQTKDKFKPENIQFIFLHERLKGIWGKNRHAQYRRCYVMKKDHVDDVLRKLGGRK